MSSTVAFPSSDDPKRRSNASVVSRQATALEVCDLVYENPFVTATSRGTIGDIYSLSHQLSKVDAPKPLSLLRHILGLGRADSEPWFQVVRMWTEIGEVCESESFGVHAGFPVPETLPQGHGFTSDAGGACRHSLNGAWPAGPLSSGGGPPDPPVPMMPVVDAVLRLPSPLHLRLPVLTRLSFNEQGRITHHRDLWDVRDLVGLFPGAALAQWIGTRLAARGLSMASRLGAKLEGGDSGDWDMSVPHPGGAPPLATQKDIRSIQDLHIGFGVAASHPAPSQLGGEEWRATNAVANGHCQASPGG
ncbi:hypothetical protein DENSPDRAFT_925949 [Dentipellis sp. KUC8613]|nr:hypothetical protein DENSPDRAFT_925949 [Dentipellis sp. KUC8613]